MNGGADYNPKPDLFFRRGFLNLLAGASTLCVSVPAHAALPYLEKRRTPAAIAEVAQGEAERMSGQARWSPEFERRVAQYCKDLDYPQTLTRFHFSAVFISWCVRQAGFSNAEFPTTDAHRFYIRRGAKREDRAFAFRTFPFDSVQPEKGDIVSFSRSKHWTYERAVNSSGSLPAESAICLDMQDRVAKCVVANMPEGMTGFTSLNLASDGYLQQRMKYPYISILRLRTKI